MATRDEEIQRQRNIEENGHSLIGTIINAGAVVGLGAAGWRFRSEIGSGARAAGEFAGTLTSAGVSKIARSAKFREAMQDMGTFAKAIHEATDSRGVISHLKNPNRFQDRFEQSLQYSLEARARMQRTQLGGEPLKALQEFQDMRYSMKAVQQQTFESIRFSKIEQDIRENMGDFAQKGLVEMIAMRGHGWLYNMSPGKVKGFTDNLISEKGRKELNHNISFKNKEEQEKFQNQLFDTLKRYQDMKSEGINAAEVKKVARKNRDNMIEGFVENNKARNDFVSKVLGQQGFRRATFEDLTMHKKGNLLKEEADAIPVPREKYGDLIEGRLGSKISKMMNVDPRFRDLVADPHLYINPRGEFLDARWMAKGAVNFADGFRQSTQVPFLRFNPLDLLHFTTWEGIRNAPKIHFKQIGTIDPALHGSVKELNHGLAHNKDAAVGMLGRGYMNTADGKVYDLTTGDLVKEGVYQGSARFGMLPRAMASVSNLHTKDYTAKKGVLGGLGRIFDIGNQETESIYKRMASTITKFDDYEWGPNILQGLKTGEQNGGLSGESAYKLLYSQLESKSTALSDDTVKYISGKINDAYGDIGLDITKLNTEEEIMSALGKLNNAINTPSSDIARVSTKVGDQLEGIDKLISDTWRKYTKNPSQFMNNQRILPNNAPYMPEWVSALDMSETDLVKKVDDVKRLIHMHASKQLEYATGMDTGGKVTLGSLVQQGIKEGELTSDALKEVRNLEGLSTMRQWWDDIYKNPDEKERAIQDFTNRALNEKDPLSVVLQDSMEDLNPWWAMGTGQEPPQYFGFVGNISMNKAKGYKWALENFNKQIEQGVSPTKALFDSVGTVISQPFAGRRNPGNVTTATLPGFYLAERLDNAVAQAGLGLSQKNRGSMQSILMNQFGRRIVLPYVAYQQALWLDGMFGDYFSDKAADTYVNMHEDVGWLKEFFGFNDIGRQWAQVFSGSDQIAEMPITRLFNFATFGIFGDNRSGEEIRKYYESGEDPIRKGRYWGIGSNTPYTGGKIDRYEPNWYRKMKSDYKFTDTMYGSESEYWANSWIPTLTHPFAPLKHFILDPYHWENKHKEDRPYPVTGGFSEIQNIPLVGPLIDNTVGRILKPRITNPDLEKAHREYIKEINDAIVNQFESAQDPGYLQGMPAGGLNILQGDQVAEVAIESGGGSGNGTGAEGSGSGSSGGSGEGSGVGRAEVGGGSGSRGARGEARRQIAMINNVYGDITGPSLGITGKNTRALTSLEDLRDPDILADLQDIGTMYSASGTLRDTVYSLGEMGGMYGFLSKTMIGFDESGRGMTLDQSSRMTSYARAWWDLELGGMGGQLSEIGRRYNPRDPNKNYWNPMKNKMPDWLPGAEYFTDFKHGDPYTKVAHGEMRLPGKAYEKLNKLHPDELGEYGAFDRFKILADVAPYSQQYKTYRQVVSKMNQAGLLDDSEVEEYREIRDQVSARKKKYRFYNRRFTNSDVQTETVTITKMINATTFLTKEHPNNPIKMAGVSVKADDEESISWLQQYVHEGATVKIAVDADPLYRVRDDMYNTMRAVVYASNSGEGLPFYMNTKGQNVNYMLANRKSGGLLGTGIGGERKATVKDDKSAVATQALFSNDMITVGKMWEGLTHDILPSLPIIGTVADKFLQIRSPLEIYKRQEIYGKAWRPWTDPIGGWIQPMLENMASQHPIVGAVQGAGIGWLFAKKGSSKFWGTRIGAVIGGAVSAGRVFIEHGRRLTGDGETWIPERRVKEREINEYFDTLQYIKYKGLYEKAKQEAWKHEGVDVEKLLAENEDRGKGNKTKRKSLESMKKWLSLSKKLGYGDKEEVEEKLKSVREDLKEIDQDRPMQPLGEYTMLALRYKAEYESTLYGADENGDMTKIFRALPNKDREFFTEFMKAAPEEREEILRLVPKNQRRFYQAKWGLKTDKKESLQKYFSEHYLPNANWDGWRPDVSLENYKVKVVKNEGLELTEFGFWGDDEKRAEKSNAKALPVSSVSSMLDVTRLEKVLRGAGLDDVKVSVHSAKAENSGENKINLSMDILKDRSKDIVSEINNNLGSIFS